MQEGIYHTGASARTDGRDVEKQKQQELEELWFCLLEIRRKGGWGEINIGLKDGRMTDLAVTVTLKPGRTN